MLPGHTDMEGFKSCIDGIERCLAKAEQCSGVLALENHWGLARAQDFCEFSTASNHRGSAV